MGREIRQVPPDWEHPRQKCKHNPWNNGCSDAKANDGQCYKPLHDKSYGEARTKYIEEVRGWLDGTSGDAIKWGEKYDWWEWTGDGPDRDFYRPDFDNRATSFQVYETVSEGTPISPVLSSLAEVKDWLIGQGYSPKASEQFIQDGSAVTFVTAGGKLMDGITAAEFRNEQNGDSE